jgi:hypothetical protein
MANKNVKMDIKKNEKLYLCLIFEIQLYYIKIINDLLLQYKHRNIDKLMLEMFAISRSLFTVLPNYSHN